jgi:hypothetical protein
MTWGLTKANCRMREIFTGRRLKILTIGERMYTGWGLKLFTEKGEMNGCGKNMKNVYSMSEINDCR